MGKVKKFDPASKLVKQTTRVTLRTQWVLDVFYATRDLHLAIGDMRKSLTRDQVRRLCEIQGRLGELALKMSK